MFFKKPTQTGYRFVDNLILKREKESIELRELQEELRLVQAVIRSKERRLEKMNLNIFQRLQSMDYLKVVSSQEKNRIQESNQNSHLKKQHKPTFRCIQGGK